VEGVHYHFVTPESFLAQVAQGVFLEYAEVFGNYYGTSREMVAAALERGEILLLTIDWQGAAQVVQAMDPADTVSIFLLPPDREVLRRRLEGRGQDLPEIIARRMAQADAEMTHWREYDYIVINDDLNEAQEGVRGIVLAERQRRERLNSRGIAILQGFNVWDSPSG
jgi:guanylate kinase